MSVPVWAWGVLAVGMVVVVVMAVVGAIGSRIFSGDGAWGTIEGYVGKPGQGKTTLGVQDAIGRARLRNAVLVTNVPIFADGVDVRLIPASPDGVDVGWLVELALQMREERRGLVLFLDEVGVWLPARLWQQFGIALMWLFQQSRKLTIELRWTAQSVTFIDSQLRELTAAVHMCRAVPPATVGRRLAGKRPWWLNVTVFDPPDVGKAGREIGRYRKLYRRRWEPMFDTDAMVLPPAKLKGAQALLDAITAALAGEREGWEVPDLGELVDGPQGTLVASAPGRNGR